MCEEERLLRPTDSRCWVEWSGLRQELSLSLSDRRRPSVNDIIQLHAGVEQLLKPDRRPVGRWREM